MVLKTYTKGVFGWSRYQPDRGLDFNGTALVTDDGTVLIIDPVAPEPEELLAIRDLGKSFVVILLNADHERAAETVAETLGADLYAPQLDLPLVKTKSAIPYAAGHVFPGGFVAVVLADMKTPGETVLYSAARRVLVVGDALIGDPVTGLRLVPPQKLRSPEMALQSLVSLLDLSFDAMYLGDGFVVGSGARDIVRRFFLAKGIVIQ